MIRKRELDLLKVTFLRFDRVFLLHKIVRNYASLTGNKSYLVMWEIETRARAIC